MTPNTYGANDRFDDFFSSFATVCLTTLKIKPNAPSSSDRICHYQSQIECIARWDISEFGESGNDHVPKIVITDRIARQPGVTRGKTIACQNGIEKHKFHRLFRSTDFGIERPKIGERQQSGAEYNFDNQRVTPVRTQPSEDGILAFAPQRNPARECEENEDKRERADAVLREPKHG